MIIQPTDKLYGADGKMVPRRYYGLRREEFDGKNIEDLRAGGHDWYIYKLPKNYDQSIHKLDGAIVFSAPTCTEGFRDLTQEEIEAAGVVP